MPATNGQPTSDHRRCRGVGLLCQRFTVNAGGVCNGCLGLPVKKKRGRPAEVVCRMPKYAPSCNAAITKLVNGPGPGIEMAAAVERGRTVGVLNGGRR